MSIEKYEVKRDLGNCLIEEPPGGMEPLIMPDLEFDKYHKLQGINNTSRKWFAEDSPLAFYARYVTMFGGGRSEALAFGSAYHSYLLEPDSFDEKYTILTAGIKEELLGDAQLAGSQAATFSKRLKTYSEWSKEVSESGRTELDEHDLKKIQQMAESMRDTPDVWDAVKPAKREHLELTLMVAYPLRREECEGKSLLLKARLDCFVEEDNRVIDFKTTRQGNAEKFARDVGNYGYDLQLAFYSIVKSLAFRRECIPEMGFLAHCNDFPYLPAIHWLDCDHLDWARREVIDTLEDIGEAIATGRFDPPDSGVLLPSPWTEKLINAQNRN